jgi:hypothetical protein
MTLFGTKQRRLEPLEGSKDWKKTATASEDRMVEREANFDGGANEGEVEKEPLDGGGCGPSDRRRSDQHGGSRQAGVGDGDGEESRRKIYANLLVEAVRRQTLLPSDLLERKLRLVACLAVRVSGSLLPRNAYLFKGFGAGSGLVARRACPAPVRFVSFSDAVGRNRLQV